MQRTQFRQETYWVGECWVCYDIPHRRIERQVGRRSTKPDQLPRRQRASAEDKVAASKGAGPLDRVAGLRHRPTQVSAPRATTVGQPPRQTKGSRGTPARSRGSRGKLPQTQNATALERELSDTGGTQPHKRKTEHRRPWIAQGTHSTSKRPATPAQPPATHGAPCPPHGPRTYLPARADKQVINRRGADIPRVQTQRHPVRRPRRQRRQWQRRRRR